MVMRTELVGEETRPLKSKVIIRRRSRHVTVALPGCVLTTRRLTSPLSREHVGGAARDPLALR